MYLFAMKEKGTLSFDIIQYVRLTVNRGGSRIFKQGARKRLCARSTHIPSAKCEVPYSQGPGPACGNSRVLDALSWLSEFEVLILIQNWIKKK